MSLLRTYLSKSVMLQKCILEWKLFWIYFLRYLISSIQRTLNICESACVYH